MTRTFPSASERHEYNIFAASADSLRYDVLELFLCLTTRSARRRRHCALRTATRRRGRRRRSLPLESCGPVRKVVGRTSSRRPLGLRRRCCSSLPPAQPRVLTLFVVAAASHHRRRHFKFSAPQPLRRRRQSALGAAVFVRVSSSSTSKLCVFHALPCGSSPCRCRRCILSSHPIHDFWRVCNCCFRVANGASSCCS